MKEPDFRTVTGVKRFVPSGFRIVTFEDVIVTFEILRLTRWPAVPENGAFDVVPAEETVTTTGFPSARMGKLADEPTGLTMHAATAAIAATRAQRVEERRPTLSDRR
jgi:hypothetical protein